jgi:hypothetical protein
MKKLFTIFLISFNTFLLIVLLFVGMVSTAYDTPMIDGKTPFVVDAIVNYDSTMNIYIDYQHPIFKGNTIFLEDMSLKASKGYKLGDTLTFILKEIPIKNDSDSVIIKPFKYKLDSIKYPKYKINDTIISIKDSTLNINDTLINKKDTI